MKALRRNLSYANVTATLALVFAMSGGALAAKHYLLNSTSQVNPRVLRSLETTDRKIFVQLSRSVTVAGAINAGTATNATHAESAGTAGNALLARRSPGVGLHPQRLHLPDRPGEGIRAGSGELRLLRNGSRALATAYNCSGPAVEARRLEAGEYEVHFIGNPELVALATADAGKSLPNPDTVSVKGVGPGDWRVAVTDVPSGKPVDDAFELLVP